MGCSLSQGTEIPVSKFKTNRAVHNGDLSFAEIKKKKMDITMITTRDIIIIS